MPVFKKIFLGLLIAFIVIQAFRPARNNSGQRLATDVTNVVQVPDTVLRILHAACYDCHSNNTRYPWYMNVQPVAWMMASHVKEGKSNLNFSEFGSYSKRKQANKLRSIGEAVKEGSMPLSSYILMHKEAKITEAEKRAITEWALKAKDSLSSKNLRN